MSKQNLNAAFRRYHAATTPAAIRKAVRDMHRDGHTTVTAEGIRLGALDELRERIEAEIAR